MPSMKPSSFLVALLMSPGFSFPVALGLTDGAWLFTAGLAWAANGSAADSRNNATAREILMERMVMGGLREGMPESPEKKNTKSTRIRSRTRVDFDRGKGGRYRPSRAINLLVEQDRVERGPGAVAGGAGLASRVQGAAVHQDLATVRDHVGLG